MKGLFYVGEPSDFSQLISALTSIDYKLDWITAAANQYDPKTLAGAGKALDFEPVYVGVGTTPFESGSPAIKQYEALFNKYLPSSTRKQRRAGAQLVLRLAAVRPVGEVVRRQRDPEVRVRRRPQGDHLDRGWPPGARRTRPTATRPAPAWAS